MVHSGVSVVVDVVEVNVIMGACRGSLVLVVVMVNAIMGLGMQALGSLFLCKDEQ